LVATIWTPTTTALLWSVTVPKIEAVVCARRGWARARTKQLAEIKRVIKESRLELATFLRQGTTIK